CRLGCSDSRLCSTRTPTPGLCPLSLHDALPISHGASSCAAEDCAADGGVRMRAVIMAGGEGLLLRPYTRILPKPMLPLGHRPILAWLMGRLVAGGVTEVPLALRELGYRVRSASRE